MQSFVTNSIHCNIGLYIQSMLLFIFAVHFFHICIVCHYMPRSQSLYFTIDRHSGFLFHLLGLLMWLSIHMLMGHLEIL